MGRGPAGGNGRGIAFWRVHSHPTPRPREPRTAPTSPPTDSGGGGPERGPCPALGLTSASTLVETFRPTPEVPPFPWTPTSCSHLLTPRQTHPHTCTRTIPYPLGRASLSRNSGSSQKVPSTPDTHDSLYTPRRQSPSPQPPAGDPVEGVGSTVVTGWEIVDRPINFRFDVP